MIETAPQFEIGTRKIGPGFPVYVIAELSANHNGSYDQAVRIIEAAAAAGADAIKLQTYRPDTITIKSDKECFRIKGGTQWDGRTLYDLYAEASLPWEWHADLKRIANSLGLDCFSSAFDPTAVDFLESLDVPVHKIASFEIVDIPLIRKMAATGKPLILSTGMATLAEIEEAVNAARDAGAKQIMLLKCTSAYPSPASEMHLRTIQHLSDTFQVPVGLSDHSMGIAVPVAAVGLGASMVEKHLTISRSHPGPDSSFSLEPCELKAMVEAIRVAEQAIGAVHYDPNPHETSSRKFRRSLFIVRDVKAGETFTEENLRSIRPGDGLHTRYLADFLGRRARVDISAGTPACWNHLSDDKGDGR